ncbi:Protein kinase-like domain superfamily [Babesia duncani]|nr:Protein kinase-like domain superfamily [Babesia duncani]
MRVLYQQCKLIHADYSPYNLIYRKGLVYVIDTSQAIEHDHPNAAYFLKRDCDNVTQFFTNVACQETVNYNHALVTMNSQSLYNYITGDFKLEECSLEIKQGLEEFENGKFSHFINSDSVQDENIPHFGPHTIEIVIARRRSFYNLVADTFSFLVNEQFNNFDFNTGLDPNVAIKSVDSAISLGNDNDLDYGSQGEDLSSSDNDSIVETNGALVENVVTTKFTGKIPEGLCPKLWKKMVKEHNRERRLHKLPKHIKKAKTKAKH